VSELSLSVIYVTKRVHRKYGLYYLKGVAVANGGNVFMLLFLLGF